MGKILPILVLIIGIAGGGAAGFVLRPAPEPVVVEDGAAPDGEEAKKPKKEEAEEEQVEAAFVKLNNQFVIPVVTETDVSSLVVMSMTLETDPGSIEILYNLEPKIRDAALRVLFNHAYAGGFDGHFTAPDKMGMLRKALIVAVNDVAGGTVVDVLITDIIRQDN